MSTPEQVKFCCAAAYSSDAAALLLGDSYHPGGSALTRRLAGLLNLLPGQRVADIASGPGATARLLAAEYGVTVDGVDLAAPAVQRAQEIADASGLSGAVRFHLGDAERIPLPSNTFDAILSECAFCTFPDKAAAALEFARVLRPGGRLGFADVTVAETGLPDDLTTLPAWVACIADARPLGQYSRILADAGLPTIHTKPQNNALVRMIDQIEARLHLLRMTNKDTLIAAGMDAEAVLGYIDITRQAVGDGLIGYALIVAEKRTPDVGIARPDSSIQ